MDGGGQAHGTACEVRSEDGSLVLVSAAPSVLLVEMRGAIGLAHVTGMTQYIEAAIQRSPGKLNIFQDLTQVSAYAMAAQLHFSEWTLERASHVDRLHFALNVGSPLISTIRAVVIALPIRAYMYRDRTSLDAAVQRAIPQTA